MVFIILLALLTCMEMASAQHKYVFPQFAFGGGWESTLMVWTDTDVGSTTCSFSAQGRFLTMRDPHDGIHEGTEVSVRQKGLSVLKTETLDAVASSGMALLDCDKRLRASYTLFSLSVNGSLVGEALVEPSVEIVATNPDKHPSAGFTADLRDGARFAVALANPSDQALTTRVLGIYVDDLGSLPPMWAAVDVPANTAKAFFIDELAEADMADRVVEVSVWPDNYPGPSVYAVGLRVNGPVFTTIPATIVEPEPTLWSHSGIGNTVFDKPFSVSRVKVTGTYSGRGKNFIVKCGGRLMINVIIGTRYSPRSYSGIHNMRGCGEVEITSSQGVRWSFTEVQ